MRTNRMDRGLQHGASEKPERLLLRVLLCGAAVLSLGAGCRTLSRSLPTSPSVNTCRQLTQQGTSAMERGDWKRAESLLTRATQTYGSDVDARRHLAETLWHRGALPEAREQMDQALKLAPEDPALAVRSGELYLALKNPDKASEMANKAMALDPKFAPAWALKGRVAAAAGQPRQALADYQRSLAYAPQEREVTLQVAEIYRQLNEPERALIAIQSVADTYTRGDEPPQLLYGQGLVLTNLGRYDEASSVLKQAALRDRSNAEYLCRLAEAELLAGRVAQAQANLQQALALDPNHAGSRSLSTRLAMSQPAAGPMTR